MLAIEARDLTKTFGPLHALRKVTLEVPPGEAVVVFGPNGAGKTTLIRVLATLARPTTGTLRLFGRDPYGDEIVRGLVGVVSHHAYVYGGLTAMENLLFAARLYGLRDGRDRAAALIDQVGLGRRAADPVRTFSRGMLQRLAIARALIHEPPLLLLDEPYTGLDRSAAARLTDLLGGLRGSRTIVMTTHSLEHGLGVADRMLILVDGAIAYEGRDGLDDPRAAGHIYADVVRADA